MANKTKLPQTNQNVFTLDDGTKEITLVNPYGKVICKLHIRPGDVSIYDRYKASRDKEKFLRGHESEIILFEAAARECKRLGAVPLPATERMQAEIDELNARKAILKAELQKAQRKEQDYAAMRQNVEDFLSPPQPEQERTKNVELE